MWSLSGRERNYKKKKCFKTSLIKVSIKDMQNEKHKINHYTILGYKSQKLLHIKFTSHKILTHVSTHIHCVNRLKVFHDDHKSKTHV